MNMRCVIGKTIPKGSCLVKKIILVVSMVAALTVILNVQPASAHSDGVTSALSCGATRPNASYILEHSHVVSMGTYPAPYNVGWVRSLCSAISGGIARCNWTSESWTSGHHFVIPREDGNDYYCVFI